MSKSGSLKVRRRNVSFPPIADITELLLLTSAPGEHLSTRQYFRLVKWRVAIAIWDAQPPPNQGVAPLQKERQPKGLPALLGRTKLESTVRYLGVELDDAPLMSEALEL